MAYGEMVVIEVMLKCGCPAKDIADALGTSEKRVSDAIAAGKGAGRSRKFFATLAWDVCGRGTGEG